MKKGFLNTQPKEKRARKRPTSSSKTSESCSPPPQVPIQVLVPDASSSSSSSWMKRGFLQNDKPLQKKNSETHAISNTPVNTSLVNDEKIELSSKKKKSNSSLLFLEEEPGAMNTNVMNMNSPSVLEKRDNRSLLNIVQETEVASQTALNDSNRLIFPTQEDEFPIIKERSTKLIRVVDEDTKDEEASYDDQSALISGVDNDMSCNQNSPSVTLQTELSTLIAGLERRHKPQFAKIEIEDNDDDDADDAVQVFLKRYLKFGEEENSCSDAKVSIPNLHFIWDSILESIAAYAKDKKVARAIGRPSQLLPPVLQIGQAILRYCPKQSLDILLNICYATTADTASCQDAVKRRKAQMLGVFVAIRCTICLLHHILTDGIRDLVSLERNEDIKNSCSLVFTLLQRGLPLFLQVVNGLTKARKRTILSVNAMDTSFSVVEYASLLYQASLMVGVRPYFVSGLRLLPVYIWQNFLLMQELVQIEKEWKGSPSGDASDLCADAVLNDWSSVFSVVQDHYDKLKLVHMVNEREAQIAAVTLLTGELSGVHLEGGEADQNVQAFLNCGGIDQTLCKHTSKTDDEIAQAFLLTLKAARRCMFQELEECPDRCIRSETVIMRTICAWLGRKKNFLSKSNAAANNGTTTQAVEICMTLLRSKSSRCLGLVDATL